MPVRFMHTRDEKIMKEILLLRIAKLVNVILVAVPAVLVWRLAYDPSGKVLISLWARVLAIGLYVVLYLLFARTYEAFSITQYRISEIAGSQILSALLADGFGYIGACLYRDRFLALVPVLCVFTVQAVSVIAWSFLTFQVYARNIPPKKTLILYGGNEDPRRLFPERDIAGRFSILESIPVKACLSDLSVIDRAEVVFLSNVHSHDRNTILKYCVDRGIVMYVLPRIGDVIMSSAVKMHMFHLPFLRTGRCMPSPEYRVLKRMFDIGVASVGLLLASPIMLIAALGIKLCDGGPVFYRQERLTKGNRRFALLKFRSMNIHAESDGVARLSTGENDPRITPVGRVLRKFRLDELPQLFNVLSGEMSIVGPRPERPEIAAQYEQVLPEFRLRLQVKAGITGYAQVYGQYNTKPYDKLLMDLMYIARPSLIEDLRICFLTVKTLFSAESTQGVDDGSITAMDVEKEQESDLLPV